MHFPALTQKLDNSSSKSLQKRWFEAIGKIKKWTAKKIIFFHYLLSISMYTCKQIRVFFLGLIWAYQMQFLTAFFCH